MKKSGARVQFIFITILLDAMGMGLLIPVLPDVIRRFTTDSVSISFYFGHFLSVYALMQFLMSPVLGSLSDRYGRRPILLSSLLGAGLDYLFMAFAPSLSLLFVGRLVSGLTGASMTVASSYMADISTDKNRSANFGLIGAGWGLGFISGPLLGGLLSSFGPQAPFLVAAGLNLLNFLFGLFVLPESLALENRRKARLSTMNPMTSILKILKPSPYVHLIWIYFILFLAGQVHPVNWTLYTQVKFGWTAWEVGLSLSFVGLVISISQGLLTRIIIPKFGEKRAFTFGLLVYLIGFGMFAFATQGWMMYAIMAFFSLSGVTMPALQSIVSRQVSPSRQGELQGSLVSLGSLASFLAPLIFSQLFVSFTHPEFGFYFPGAAYLGASVLCGLAFCIDRVRR